LADIASRKKAVCCQAFAEFGARGSGGKPMAHAVSAGMAEPYSNTDAGQVGFDQHDFSVSCPVTPNSIAA
jgi:hypothetical protein